MSCSNGSPEDTGSADVDRRRLQGLLHWHFSEETGSPFWLDKKPELDFDPLRDIASFDDLERFPDVTESLRSTPIEDLIPRGVDRDALVGIFESGGTTGTPKRVAVTQQWWTSLLEWSAQQLEHSGFPCGGAWLGLVPQGPHVVGRLFADTARRFGAIPLTVDLDPRWVKTLLRDGDRNGADAYSRHLTQQAVTILESQDIRVLTITPALIETGVQNQRFLDLVRNKVKAIRWGGTHLDPATHRYFREELFPGIAIHGHYGNTMTLGIGSERRDEENPDGMVFDSFSPWTSYRVVDQAGNPVDYGTRGQVRTSHISESAFIPNNLERDTAIRVPALPGHVGDAVSSVAAVGAFADVPVIEGVY